MEFLYASDEEKVDALKKWWKDNGKAMIVGVVLGLGAIVGWRAWVEYRQNESAAASSRFEQLMTVIEAGTGEADTVLGQGEAIIGDYASTPYAALAGLALAKFQMEHGDPASAQRHLRRVLDETDHEEMRHVARIRLARALLQGDDADAAGTLLEGAEFGVFAALYEEVKGDVANAKGDHDKARAAYREALAKGSGNSDFLQMKLDDLGAAAEPAS